MVLEASMAIVFFSPVLLVDFRTGIDFLMLGRKEEKKNIPMNTWTRIK